MWLRMAATSGACVVVAIVIVGGGQRCPVVNWSSMSRMLGVDEPLMLD